jgi:hypothetical protein
MAGARAADDVVSDHMAFQAWMSVLREENGSNKKS